MSLFNFGCKQNKKQIEKLENKIEVFEKTIEHNERVFKQVLEGLSRELDLSIYIPSYYFSSEPVSVIKRTNKK